MLLVSYLIYRQLWLVLDGLVDVSSKDRQGIVHCGGKYKPGQVSRGAKAGTDVGASTWSIYTLVVS